MSETKAEELQTDWALRELLAGEAPPDLLPAVRQRLASPRPEARAASRWFAVACGVLAVVVLTAVWIERGSVRRAAVPAVQPTPQSPAEVRAAELVKQVQNPDGSIRRADSGGEGRTLTVHTSAELAAAPADTEQLIVLGAAACDLTGIEKLGKLRALDLAITDRTDPVSELRASDFARIGKIATLRDLVLDGRTEVTAAWLKQLAALPQFENLSAMGLQLDSAGVAAIVALPRLQRVYLGFDQQLVDADIAALASIPGLRELRLRGCSKLTSAGLQQLRAAKSLRFLDAGLLNGKAPTLAKGHEEKSERMWLLEMTISKQLWQTTVGCDDAAVAVFAALPQLERLMLDYDPLITSAAMKGLGKRASLTSLSLSATKVDDSGLAELPVGLVGLGLAYTEITDAGLKQLAERMPSLTALELNNCARLTDDGIKALLAARELTSLRIDGCRGLTPAIVPALLACKSLAELRVGSKLVDDDAAKAFEAMPNMRHFVREQAIGGFIRQVK